MVILDSGCSLGNPCGVGCGLSLVAVGLHNIVAMASTPTDKLAPYPSLIKTDHSSSNRNPTMCARRISLTVSPFGDIDTTKKGEQGVDIASTPIGDIDVHKLAATTSIRKVRHTNRKKLPIWMPTCGSRDIANSKCLTPLPSKWSIEPNSLKVSVLRRYDSYKNWLRRCLHEDEALRRRREYLIVYPFFAQLDLHLDMSPSQGKLVAIDCFNSPQ